MAEDRLRVGIIGAGGRGINGYVRFFEDAPVPIQLSAVADPSEENRHRCVEKAESLQGTKPAVYTDWRTMLDEEEHFDGMIIATPNYLHYEPAMACIEKGVRAIALEKPLATSPDECNRIVNEAHARGVAVQLGFVLRSAPFYQKVKELVDNGKVGRIVSVQADELVSLRVSSVNFRGPWRRYTALSGGSLLEKCCHDMDMLNWLVGSRPRHVSSFGGRAVFQPNGFLPDRCDSDCPLHHTCPYYHERKRMSGFQGIKMRAHTCIFNADGDVADHQSVQIAFENDVVCNFMLNFNTEDDRSSRNLHIIGTRGRVWGNMAQKVVMSHDLVSDEITEHPLTVDQSGHGGSNYTHAMEFVRLVAGRSVAPVASAYDAYLSAMLCFAADRSRLERRQVRMRYPRQREIDME